MVFDLFFLFSELPLRNKLQHLAISDTFAQPPESGMLIILPRYNWN